MRDRRLSAATFGNPAAMGAASIVPIALLAHTTAAANVGDATSAAIDTTGATLIVISQSSLASLHPSPTDSKGNTWTALTLRSGGNLGVQLWYCNNPVVGSGHTFTAKWDAGAFTTIAVGAFSLVANAAPTAETGTGSASATTLQPGNITPGSNNMLLVAGVEYVSGTVPGPATINGGFTIAANAGNAGTTIPTALAYLVQTTAAAANPTWSSNAAADRMAVAMASFAHS